MNAIELLKSKIAKGEITAGRKASTPVGEGTFECVVESAEFADNFKKTAKRAMIKYKVLRNLTDPTDVKSIGGLFNTYIATGNAEFMEQNIATYVQVLEANGFDSNKIYEDVETLENVVEEIATIIGKAANRNKQVIVHVKRKEQDKKSATGQTQYYTDIMESTWKKEDSDVALELAEDAETVEAPAETVEAPEAPEAPKAEKADPASQPKPWEV